MTPRMKIENELSKKGFNLDLVKIKGSWYVMNKVDCKEEDYIFFYESCLLTTRLDNKDVNLWVEVILDKILDSRE